MLARIWTAFLLSLAGVSAIAWLVALMHEKDIRPVQGLMAFFKNQSKVGSVVFITMFIVFGIIASTKRGGGTGTTGVPPVESGNPAPVPDEWENFVPITSTNTTHTLTGDDFRRGFVLARVGTGEQFDFSAPSDAVVCSDWQAFGAATDWIYVAFTNWAFQVGTNEIDRLRIHSDGWVEAGGSSFCSADGGADAQERVPPVFAPFMSSLGIVPEANWDWLAESDRPSQLWHCVTPSNTLQVTWQNALLGRDTDTPLSFQIEFEADGRFTCRYDLSRVGGRGATALPDGVITNLLAGASLGGLAWVTNALPTNVTSMAFCPLAAEDAYNPDSDGDGLPTVDELFVYHTDPHNPDTDYDGLTDYEELFVHGTDPLNSHSVSDVYSDGFALKIGGENPFSYPEGSTNTVLEHVFYSGTTNGAFAYPQSSDDMAVLRVSVSGSGTGDLIVGSQVVPLVAQPPLRGDPPRHVPLLVRVVKGETHRLFRRGNPELDVSLSSDDFAFGSLPVWSAYGHVNFPNTIATQPCIHDFNARRRRVSLPTGRDADELTATWSTSMMDVVVSNIPPRSATVTGYFNARGTSGITYELNHPQYLFGEKVYSQTVRFCPRPPDPDPEDPDPVSDPSWYDDGDGDPSDSNDPGHDERWCCFWGSCDGSCGCGDAACCGGGGDAPGDFDDDCPVHHVPYAQCAPQHASDYTNGLVNVEHLGGVLYIRDPPVYEQIDLAVPSGHVNCCPCPDHSTNYVGVAYKSYRLRLVDANGLPFRSSGESCTVNLAGVRPSAAAGDATLAFARNGEIYRQYDKTVLGVSIRGGAVDLETCNALNASFGYPMAVCTNLADSAAPDMKLVTDVKLPGGHVHLELFNATAPFAVWYYDRRNGAFRKLLDTASTPVKDLSMAYWKVLMKRAVNGDSNEMPVYVTSSAPGRVKLRFRYWNVIDGRFVQDEAVQAVTSVKPPLLADYNWDFSADIRDALDQGDGRTLYFWTNHDTWTGDDAFAPYSVGHHPWPMTLPDNSGDMVVDGRNDLVNLCPLAVDLSKFMGAWGTTRVQYVFYTGSPGNVRFVPVRTKWRALDKMVKEEQKTVAGEDLHSAELLATSVEGGRESGYVLPPGLLSLGASRAGVLAVEFVTEGLHTLRVAVKDSGSGDVLFDSAVSVRALDVHDMYRWLNLEYACGVDAGPKYADRLSVLWPDSEHADANVVFVHGYNVHPSEAWDWSQAMFKRLWWSGMDAGFTAVLWRGNESQWWFPKVLPMSESNGYATKNYHQNVLNAFRTAGAFATNVNDRIPGARKYMIAHSLGNMLVSAARQFHGLQYEKYFMLNAAVPIEAYDAAGAVTEASKRAMTPSVWRPYPDRVRSSHWYELFLGTPGDARQGLTWKGLFKDVDNTINFYSSQDEVVANGNGGWKNPLTRKFAWYNQERARGSYLVSFSPQAGWEFSDHYIKADFVGLQNGVEQYHYRGYEPDETFSIADTNLMVRPFFKDFSDERIYGEGGSAFLQANDMVRWYALSHGIPAESFAAGANPVPKWGRPLQGEASGQTDSDDVMIRNADMARDCVPAGRKELPWIHSYFIQNSLFDTQVLYEVMVKQIGSTNPQNAKEAK